MYDLSVVVGAATVAFAIGGGLGWWIGGYAFHRVREAFCDHERLLLQQIQVQFGEMERMSTLLLKTQRELIDQKRLRN